MEKLYYEDIITAKATANGAAAIAIVRVSGKDCLKMLDTIFRIKGKKPIESHRVCYGDIIDGENIIDSVVVLPFRDGSGFTGEEAFEIQCHGSPIVTQMILQLLCKNGARLAEPGEFSKRAFLNGKIDLSQAEAIMDIVNASTKQSAMMAARQLNGLVEKELTAVKERLTDLLAKIEVFIDYPEEDISVDAESWLADIAIIKEELRKLLAGFNRGRYLREGVRAVLLGKTNSGKSTIFNTLLHEDKAIVSDIHGTTRDYLDGVINIGGFGVRLYDTAGLRMTDDPIEREGTRRSVELAKNCDIVLFVIDGTADLTENEENIRSLDDKKTLFIINKTDAPQFYADIKTKLSTIVRLSEYAVCEISALKQDGIDKFNEIFQSLLIKDNVGQADAVITNVRHAELLEDALTHIDDAADPIRDGVLDIGAFELRDALDRIGEITGAVTREDVLNRIFEKFCVGK